MNLYKLTYSLFFLFDFGVSLQHHRFSYINRGSLTSSSHIPLDGSDALGLRRYMFRTRPPVSLLMASNHPDASTFMLPNIPKQKDLYFYEPISSTFGGEAELRSQTDEYTKNNYSTAKTCILFYTGGNSIISHEIYSSLLTTLSKKNIAIYSIPFQYNSDDFDALLKKLSTTYQNIISLSHSSGSISLIEQTFSTPLIKHAILMDPIDVRLNRSQKILAPYMKKIMIIRAEKSYKGVSVDSNTTFRFFDNISIPFIPKFLELSKDKFKLPEDCIIETVCSKDFGHCDLLNPLYSNMVYNTVRHICNGSSNRDSKNLYGYIQWLAKIIAYSADDSCNKNVCNL